MIALKFNIVLNTLINVIFMPPVEKQSSILAYPVHPCVCPDIVYLISLD